MFFIITAWFLIEKADSKRIIEKVIHISITVIEYLLFFLAARIIAEATGLIAFDTKISREIVGGFLQPLWIDRYWFPFTYITLLVLSPVYNKCLLAIDLMSKKKLVIVMGIYMLVNPFIGKEGVYVTNIFYATFIYLTVDYLKCISFTVSVPKGLTVYFICKAILILGNYAHRFAGDTFNQLLHATIGYAGRYQILQIIMAIVLFYLFVNLHVKENRIINYVGSLTFGIYLFHCNQIFDISLIMYRVFVNGGSITRILKVVLLIISIFALGCVFEIFRRKALYVINNRIKGQLDKAIDRYIQKSS